MKGAVLVLFFAIAIATCWATVDLQQPKFGFGGFGGLGCTCPNLLTGVANLITQLQTALAPLLTSLGGLGSAINQLLEFLKTLVNNIGGALSNGGLLGGVNNLVTGLLQGIVKT
ncbi:unnamed protein product [Phyllotreta striolata]|uniref:Secreted protein n=1 Tax=Phyllotreta striolata TaxID=444603 RepID=A0A9N9TEP4_PHYSR|nr:unnamed protein product [Phyllotreta striolata]